MDEEKEISIQKLDNLNLSDQSESDDDDEASETEFIDIHSDSSAMCNERLSTPIEETGDAHHIGVSSQNQFALSDSFGAKSVGVSSQCTEQSTLASVCAPTETFHKESFGGSMQCSDAAKKLSDSSEDEYHSADDGDKNNSDDGGSGDKTKKKEIIDDEDYRKTIEESLSDYEKLVSIN